MPRAPSPDLEYDVDTQSLAATTPAGGDGDATERRRPDAAEVRPPATARYAFDELIGKGGMGEVWLADDRSLGREVAVKIARPGTDADGLARFLREARIQGQLDHPAVVPVHELGELEGRPYFAMKRVRGETLAAVCARLIAGDVQARARYTARRLLTAFVSACHAVEVAHGHGVIHRDLKPANLMLGDHGEVYVLDWGLAKPFGGVDKPASSPPLPTGVASELTAAGLYMGTPGYMAPEQARGEPLDERADVYALGATLFEMLTLVPLVPRGPAAAVIAATLAGVDARASLRATATVPPELEVVCVRATALRPSERYPTVASLREAIERYLDGDRDLERRHALADRAAAAAAALRDRALAGDAAARSQALAELGQALALEPSHAAAQAQVMELLVAPPRETPPEVERAVAAAEKTTYAQLAGVGAWIYVVWLPLALCLAWMGIRDVEPLLGWVGFTVATAVAMLAGRARARPDAPTYFAALVLSSIAIAISSRVFGAFILTPTLMTMNAVGFAVAARRQWWLPTVAIAVAFLVAPAVLEATGAIASTTAVVDGALVVRSGVVAFREPQATLLMLGASALFLIMVTVAAGELRGRMLAQTRKAELAAWQLRQLVPRIDR